MDKRVRPSPTSHVADRGCSKRQVRSSPSIQADVAQDADVVVHP